MEKSIDDVDISAPEKLSLKIVLAAYNELEYFEKVEFFDIITKDLSGERKNLIINCTRVPNMTKAEEELYQLGLTLPRRAIGD